jgi:hypothetical protein
LEAGEVGAVEEARKSEEKEINNHAERRNHPVYDEQLRIREQPLLGEPLLGEESAKRSSRYSRNKRR